MFAAFEAETDYFGSRTQQAMLDFRVRDLEAMLTQLRARSVDVGRREAGHLGCRAVRLGDDPEGSRVEL